MQETDFFAEINRLKSLKRKGWMRCNINNPESVADHSWRTAILALVLSPENLERERVVNMAIVHDLGEIDAGDITPFDGISPEKKHMLEESAISRISDLPGSEEVKQIWTEYEEQKTPEARFARELDVLEMAMQALEYERTQMENIKKDEWTFWRYAEERITSPVLLKIFNEMKLQSEKLWNR